MRNRLVTLCYATGLHGIAVFIEPGESLSTVHQQPGLRRFYVPMRSMIQFNASPQVVALLRSKQAEFLD